MKKIFTLTLVLLFALSTVCFAAKGGVKIRMPSPKAPTTQSAPSPKGAGDYKPSAPAQSYGNKAPATAKPNTQAGQPMQLPGGGFLRTAGLLGGGMLLGSMLGGMFGFGSEGMFAMLIGMFFNIIILVGIFMAGRFLWNKLKTRDTENDYRRR